MIPNEETFCRFLDYLKELDRKTTRLAEILRDYAEDDEVTDFCPVHIERILHFIAELIGDTEGWLDWWAWDADFGDQELGVVTTKNGQQIQPYTSKDLYGIMAEQYDWENQLTSPAKEANHEV